MGEIPASVHYRLSDDVNETCSTCAFWQAGRCTLFDAAVAANYTCDRWKAPEPAVAAPDAPSAATHNAVLAKGYKRADDLEARLVKVLTPILRRAGRDAATNFQTHALDHLAASGLGVVTYSIPVRDDQRLVAAAPAQNSAMIALKPTPEQAAALAMDGGENPADLHVTLAYLGETDDDLAPLVDALAPVAGSHAPLQGTVGGVGVFSQGIGIVLPDVPGLVELRQAAVEALAKHGVDYGRDHGYTAHVTAATGDSHAGVIDPDYQAQVAGLPLSFDAIYVVRGDVVEARLPLTGAKPLTAAGGKKPDPGITQAQLQARVAAVEDAKQQLRDAINRGASNAEVEAYKAQLRTAQHNLYAAASVNPTWAAPLPAQVLDVNALVLSLRTKTEPVRQAAVQAMMDETVKQAGLSWDVTSPFADKAFVNTGKQITNIAQTTQDNVAKVIRASYDQGLSIPDTAKAIRAAMNAQAQTRAVLIARTELASATNSASVMATRAVEAATGTKYSKTWRTAFGAKHPRHELYPGLDGQTRASLDATFEVGEAQLQFPGDPDGPPEETCNCLTNFAVARSHTVTHSPMRVVGLRLLM